MRHTMPIAAAAAALVAAVATHSGGASAQAGSGTYLLREGMVEQVNPAMLAIWDVTNNAMADDGSLDPARIDDAGWAAIADQANRLAAFGHDLAAAETVQVAAADNMATEEYEIPMSRVQVLIDRDPDGIRALAAAFAQRGEDLHAAAEARDVATASELVNGMDAVCESCHMQYWYAED